MGFKRKAQSFGAEYVEGQVVDFHFGQNPGSTGVDEIPNQLVVNMANGTEQSLTFRQCVIAAGAHSGAIARKARIGEGPGVLSTPLPVVPR